MMIPSTQVKSFGNEIGLGLVAMQPIPMGTITYVIDPLDVVLSPTDPRLVDPNMQVLITKYAYADKYENKIVCWDNAKYVNHSCAANTLPTAYGFELAIRDIAAGEPITRDYGLLNLDAPLDPCRCRASACRSQVSPDDVNAQRDVWDQQVRDALRWSTFVDQPLWELVPHEVQDALRSLMDNNNGYRSVRTLVSTAGRNKGTPKFAAESAPTKPRTSLRLSRR